MTIDRYSNYRDSGIDWQGDVPMHWDVAPLKSHYNIVGGATPKSDQDRYWDGDIPWVTPADLSRLETQFISTSLRTITEDGLNSCAASVLPPQSIVLSTRAPIGSLGISAVPLATNQGCKGLVPKDTKSSAPFLAYVLSVATEQLNVRGKGTTFLELSGDELARFKIAFPPADEQAAIADFLSQETGKIDALVETQRRLIDLLNEKRRADICHVVTKGLDRAAPLKDSGVEWIGEVPAHWQVQALKRVTESCCDGPFGSGLKSEHYVDDGVRVIRLQNIKEQGFDGSDAAYIDVDYFETALSRHDVRQGDVLIAGLGDERNLVGRACVAPVGVGPAMVKADCFRFRLGPEANSEFVALQLNAGAAYASGKMSTGSTRSRIALSSMMDRLVVIPPLPEQQEIVARLASKVDAATALIKQAEAGIVLLLERRAALISAAVTGKIDVRRLLDPVVTADTTTARRLVGATILELVADTRASGRMTSAKRMYLAEAHAGVWELRGQPQRMAAGPFDGALMSDVETELARAGHIATSQPGGPNSQVHYRMTGVRGALRAELDALLGDRRIAFDKMLTDLGELESKGVEAVATLFAVWNDMLIDGETPTDDAVVDGVLNDWHVEKRDKFTKADLRNYLGWMSRHGMTPTGRGPRTKSGALL